ncbi:hypothetical protein VNO77_26764 [Canavalia gladiata]|uniref:Uncharacterized protein n=1 Tax=Canavalia gladiata TaxID=3824 RepID=A0AAN9Q9X8_CANGL
MLTFLAATDIGYRYRLHFRQDSFFNSLPLGRGFSTRILSLSNKYRDVKSCLVEFKLSTGNLVDLGGCVLSHLNQRIIMIRYKGIQHHTLAILGHLNVSLGQPMNFRICNKPGPSFPKYDRGKLMRH